MKAAVLRAGFDPTTPFRIEDVDLAAPRKGEVRIRMKAVGVCHSDWHLVTGATRHPLPLVPGHEGAGVVEEVGEGVDQIEVGDHVSLSWAPNCGECFYCLHDRPSLCAAYVGPIWAGTMMDGTTRLSVDGDPIYHYCSLACFAEQVVVPVQCCVPMPRDIPFSVLALIGCAVSTGVGSVLNTAKVTPGSSVAVYGVGGVGLSTVLGARVAGASTIIAIDLSPERREAALALGATHALAAGPGVVDEIRRLTEGRGADYVFEAAGLTRLQEEAVEAARPGGTVVYTGLSGVETVTHLSGARITRQEKTIMGSYYGTANPARDFPRFGEMYLNGRLDLDRMITKTYPLEQINEAYQDLIAGRGARGVVEFLS